MSVQGRKWLPEAFPEVPEVDTRVSGKMATAIKSWEALASILGTTARSLSEWRKLDAAPSGREHEEWRAFMRARGLGPFSLRQNAPTGNDTPTADEAALRLVERRLRVEREQMLLQKARGELLPRVAMEMTVTQMVSDFTAVLQRLPDRCAGKLVLRVRALCLRNMRVAYPNQNEKFFAKIEEHFDRHPIDYADVIEILEAEMNQARTMLADGMAKFEDLYSGLTAEFDASSLAAIGCAPKASASA